jgi:sugar (pentulose or hexulose) kinase
MAQGKPAFLTLDAGTSRGCAALFDEAGHLLGQAVQTWQYEAPNDCALLGREFRPDEFWLILCDAARQACKPFCDGKAYQVTAVAATAQRQAMVLLDGAGRELYAGPNIDLRGAFEGLRLLHQSGPRIHAITGHLPPMMFAPARWLWFSAHRPEVCDQTAHLLMMPDWLTWRLCGQIVTEPSSAAESGLFDVTRRTWSEELALEAGIPLGVLPEICRAGEVAGRLAPSAAADLGLAAGLPVVVAGSDTSCGMLAMEVTHVGQAGLVAGWSAPCHAVLDEPLFDPSHSLWTTCTAAGTSWALEGNSGPAGSAHRWARDVLMSRATYEEFDEVAALAPPGSGAALAFLGPRVADYADPTLLWGGFLFPQANDLVTCGRAELARAVLENIAFAVKANLLRLQACLRESGRGSPAELRLGGGLSRSVVFVRILADVLGMPVWVAEIPDVAALGAAACAATGAGSYASVDEAAKAMRRPGVETIPLAAAQAEYLDAYERWMQAYQALSDLSKVLP